ncbi:MULTISPECIES: hypothetical protein [unclassified Streptomyces]|uniref:hypothetical protein n=1 Tax=unclassified Streptomyces TaxID=2593676 RepID=UPI002E783E75|nr:MULTISPECIES: hypothetical protein [unclassified Streptomyces]MEE1761356.1 hypothetical protein [Streptomyces sp. SP18BB07]MEE1836053.1 hypothetical protein [Streptomyces sp. SP17KL33]
MAEHGPTTPSALSALRERAEHRDHSAVDELIELAAEQEDLHELRRLADRAMPPRPNNSRN